MKIGSVPRASQTNPYAEVARKNQVSRASFHGADKVEFSQNARQFKTLLQEANNTPDVRMDRVEALRAQIGAGTYKVDSRAVAEKLIENLSITL